MCVCVCVFTRVYEGDLEGVRTVTDVEDDDGDEHVTEDEVT